MFSVMRSSSVLGVEGKSILVEVDIASGLPQVNVVGLPDPAVRESVERVRAAIKNSGFTFPMDRITVNLAPADMRKEGTAFDLAIAAGILTASDQISGKPFEDAMLIGELSLNGLVRPVPGVLSMIEQAKRSGIRKVLLPQGNAKEAAWIGGMELYALNSLGELRGGDDGKSWDALRYISQPGSRDSLEGSAPSPYAQSDTLGDYSDVIGQQHAKRALVIAAAGRHNLLFSGPPGTGKTMMIRRLPGILPPLTEAEALEVTKIYSAAGKLSTDAQGLIQTVPFRSPHHTISAGGLIGGGSVPKPGEVTLAHRGVLYLDELPEFSRQVLEVMRQPLEDGIVTIARSKAVFHFPARLMLAVSYNPCPCGYYGHETTEKQCTCSDAVISRYRAKLSGPLLDRIDLQLEVPRPMEQRETGASYNEGAEMNSAHMRKLVLAARERQSSRLALLGLRADSRLSGASLRRSIKLLPEALAMLENALEALGISMRAYDRILRLSRTIADVEGSDAVEAEHVAEAIQYRRLNG
ncbi:YifB family Mg chelatase-like AAA ATPase [Paenibacillus radicis (ex Gao et al. 2016)]|uniref:Magnesium chelatase n=1 Tax=Paenibacillus radicis (ex Gao et al. 2016) TaxID=1737354 RepID=A0A917HJU8_9BACL|nr:YifB family Mg chelatase-like AAA ATPase [Paenibacillus radicis (ex Gao et al. 2016)]GGG80901.1 magnesium chelatase [Paenibacillus radicis (ex Gao et al. 2016)]